MKKTISIILVFIFATLSMTGCTGVPKDANYLYNWLTENGKLVNGTCLRYYEVDNNGNTFSLCYDTNYSEKLVWRVEYITKEDSRRTISTTLYLFCDSESTPAKISVEGAGYFYGYNRYMEYSVNPKKFTNNSPISMGSCDGSTIVRDVFKPGQGVTTVVDDKEGLKEELDVMDRMCKENAQKNLCILLDWLKYSFCSKAKMSMSDFGYDSY